MGLLTKLKTASTIVNRPSTSDYDLVIGSAFPEIDIQWPSGTGDNEANVRWATIANAIANSAMVTCSPVETSTSISRRLASGSSC